MSTIMRGNLYVLSYFLGAALLILITLFRRKIYSTSIIRALIYSIITFVSGFCGAFLGGQLFNVLALLKKITAAMFVDVIGAVIFTSLFLLGAIRTEKKLLNRRVLKAETESETSFQPWQVSFRDTMDLVIPGAFVVFGCIKAGCFVRGCCFGIECSWGVTAQFYYSKTVFPVQIFESASIFAIAAASHFVQRAAFYRRGMSGPFAAFLYGMIRFFWEFFRYNPPELRNFFLGLTIWQLFCLLVLIVSGVWMWILIKTQPCDPKSIRLKPKQKTKKKLLAKQKDSRSPIQHKKNAKR